MTQRDKDGYFISLPSFLWKLSCTIIYVPSLPLFSRPGQSQGLLYKQHVIHSFSNPFPPTAKPKRLEMALPVIK